MKSLERQRSISWK